MRAPSSHPWCLAWTTLLSLLSALCLPSAVASEPPVGASWYYTLLPDSQLIDDAPLGGRPTIFAPLRGTFELECTGENPLYAVYQWKLVAWSADGANSYKLAGHGTHQVGGEVALTQELFLELTIDSGATSRVCYFTNGSRPLTRLWPMIAVSVDQTNGLAMQTFRLDLFAAPIREIWFSTSAGFTPGIWPGWTNRVSGGDLVSSKARVVRRNEELTRRLGIMPMVSDLGLDAVDILPGGEVVFSTGTDDFSELLGPLHNGDLLSEGGRLVADYTALIGAFGPEPPVADEGLDALQVQPDGEVYFSVAKSFFSERTGQTIGHGDLLSSRGVVVRRNAELIARFQPKDAKADCGLRAVHVWPSGEVWFSLETGFTGPDFATYHPGDLLSDQGYVVCRNLDLVGTFQPLEDTASFGLDALFVVTDTLPSAAAPPKLDPAGLQIVEGTVRIEWSGEGRLFQLEKAAAPGGTWMPVGPITPDLQFVDPSPLAPAAYYRLRQW